MARKRRHRAARMAMALKINRALEVLAMALAAQKTLMAKPRLYLPRYQNARLRRRAAAWRERRAARRHCLRQQYRWHSVGDNIGVAAYESHLAASVSMGAHM